MASADLELSVPYPMLLAEYQQRVAALTNENLMLRATVAHLQQQRAAPAPSPTQPVTDLSVDAVTATGDG